MKRGEISQWTNMTRCSNLLFFAQLVNELLFDYSIPSNRISTLNSHYLCLDALSTIEDIEKKNIHEGNLKPIIEELFSELEKDPVFSEENKPNRYFAKFVNGKYQKVRNVSELNYYDMKTAVKVVEKKCFHGDIYYNRLKEKIKEIIQNNKAEEQQVLFRLTKSILTELVNGGYTSRYIRMVVKSIFWNKRVQVTKPEHVNRFFECFDFGKKDYIVVFKVQKRKIYPFKDNTRLTIGEICTVDTTFSEGIKYKIKHNDECFVQIELPGIDPFQAADGARFILDTYTAVYRMHNHFYKYKMSLASCGVFDKEGHFYKGDAEVKPVQHRKKPSERQISESMEVAFRAMHETADEVDFLPLLNAIRFHSHSLDSINEENQLLDLWAIFETVLDISGGHSSDRINQICMLLVPLLKRHYIYSLFDQLAEDINNYNKDLYNSIVNDCQDVKEKVRCICEFTLLESKKEERERALEHMNDFPLLKERIEYYNSKLNTPNKVFQFVEKHADRVKWQVMRIYRNRNLIIHKGESMPYLNLLIENLHSYVDDFLSYTIHSLSEGNDVLSMCQDLYISECGWIESFTKSKAPITAEEISEMLIV